MEKEAEKRFKSIVKKDVKKTEEDEEVLVDIGSMDIEKILKSFSNLKKQNAYLFDIIQRLSRKDKNFEKNIDFLGNIAKTIKNITEKDFKEFENFIKEAENANITKKHLKQIATVNSPNREAVRYGQAFVDMRKSFLNMAVKRASSATERETDKED